MAALGCRAIQKPFWKVLSKGVLIGLDAVV